MESKSFNFVELIPEEIHELIFKYLSVSELLTAALVHSSWDESIGASKTVMDRIKLNLDKDKIKPSNSEEVSAILIESRRQYQHLELSLFGPKSVSLINVIDLSIWKSFRFRGNIKQDVRVKIIDRLLERCSNLVSIDLQMDGLELTGKLLTASTKLKKLSLKGRLESDEIFNDLDLKLQALHLDTWRDYNKAPDENPQVFNNFLKSQADTLSALSVDFGSYGPFVDRATLQVILSMPKLTDLTLSLESHFLLSNRSLEDLPENRSVINLNLLLNFHNFVRWGIDNMTKSFMKMFYNVKTLRLKELHLKIFQFIEEVFPSLEDIIIEDTIYMSADTSNSSAFPHLQCVKFGRAINPELEQRLKDAAEDELGNFSKCLLQELQNHSNNEREFRSSAVHPTLVLMASELE